MSNDKIGKNSQYKKSDVEKPKVEKPQAERQKFENVGGPKLKKIKQS